MVTERLPFIVAGSPRTGSSLVLLGLAAHPHVRTFGELFHPWADPRPGAGPTEQDRFDETREEALAFLDRTVWAAATAARPAVGFKLFVSHTKTEGTRDLFFKLSRAMPHLRVIHCLRANYLDAWVSLKKAETTGVWAQFPGDSEPPTPRPISVSSAELMGFFEEMEANDALLRTFHDPKRCHVVDYGELATGYAPTMESLWRFLGLPSVETSPALVKQNRASLTEFLQNYDELRERFAQTRFSTFFREGV